MATVYYLKCPITLHIRYVGCTTIPLEKRLNEHINGCTNAIRHWVCLLSQRGKKPIIEEAKTCELKKAKRLEIKLIDVLSDIYTDQLLNVVGNPYRDMKRRNGIIPVKIKIRA